MKNIAEQTKFSHCHRIPKNDNKNQQPYNAKMLQVLLQKRTGHYSKFKSTIFFQINQT